MPDGKNSPLSHHYVRKKEADYAIGAYGSELAGDILFCAVCNRPHDEHPSHIRMENHNKEPKMDRDTVYKVIAKEREYQNTNWPRDNHPLVKQYAYAAPHLLMLDEYLGKARALWTKSQDEVDVLQTIAKMATIAFRALEEIVQTDGQRYNEMRIKVLINDERDSQDARHPRTKDNAGQYNFSAPHLKLVGHLLRTAEDDWYVGNRERVTNALVKVAAVLVRALEEIDGPNLLFTGLR